MMYSCIFLKLHELLSLIYSRMFGVYDPGSCTDLFEFIFCFLGFGWCGIEFGRYVGWRWICIHLLVVFIYFLTLEFLCYFFLEVLLFWYYRIFRINVVSFIIWFCCCRGRCIFFSVLLYVTVIIFELVIFFSEFVYYLWEG